MGLTPESAAPGGVESALRSRRLPRAECRHSWLPRLFGYFLYGPREVAHWAVALVVLSFYLVTFWGLVRPCLRTAWSTAEAGAHFATRSEADVRRALLGSEYEAGIERIRASLPPSAQYVLACDGYDVVDFVAYDLAPRLPALVVDGPPTVTTLRSRWRPEQLPEWAVIVRRDRPSPSLVRTADLFR